MRTLRRVSAQELVIESRPVGAAVLLIVPLIALVVPLPWVFSETSSSVGRVASGVLGLLVISLVHAVRTQSLPIALPADARLVLEPSLPDDDSTYRVFLESRGAPRTLVLEHHDPARVVADLRRIMELVPVSVQSAWGLSEAALLRRRPALELAPAADGITGRAAAEQRNIAHALLGTAAFELAVVGWCAAHAPAPPAALSLALGFGTVGVLALLGAALYALRVRVRVNAAGLQVERGVGSFARSRTFPRETLLGADAVGPALERPRHVLIDTRSGLTTLALDPGAARAVAALFSTGATSPGGAPSV